MQQLREPNLNNQHSWEVDMTHKPSSKQHNSRASQKSTAAPDGEYKVGPGHPPKEHQWPPGQSGNPAGAKRKTQSLGPDVKKLLSKHSTGKLRSRRGKRSARLACFRRASNSSSSNS